MKVKNSIFLFLVLAAYSCTTKSYDSVQEMIAASADEDNGYRFEKSVGYIQFTLQYKPTDLLVKQEIGEEKVSDETLEEIRKKYRKYMYFNLSMSKNNKELLSDVAGDQARFGRMVNELAFGMDQKVHLYSSRKDTIPMADFIYPRMYGMSNSTSVLIVFPRDEKYINGDEVTFAIEDLGMNTGEVKFKINTEALIDEPQLRFN